MTLIALLIALCIERLYPLPAVWSIDFYMQRWMNWSQAKVNYFREPSAWTLLLQILLPAALAWLLFHWLDSGLVQFIGGIIVLLLVMNAGPERLAYKQLVHRRFLHRYTVHARCVHSLEADAAPCFCLGVTCAIETTSIARAAPREAKGGGGDRRGRYHRFTTR